MAKQEMTFEQLTQRVLEVAKDITSRKTKIESPIEIILAVQAVDTVQDLLKKMQMVGAKGTSEVLAAGLAAMVEAIVERTDYPQ